MKQYFSVKAKYPDAILLFRVGDFYETYGKDAVIAVEILNIALTSKANGPAGKIEMAGFPFHGLTPIYPILRAGKRVAICDQREDPKKTKTLVKRGITELVTPGFPPRSTVLDNGEFKFWRPCFLIKKGRGCLF
jgi:DNA mismatch repair protein MutS